MNMFNRKIEAANSIAILGHYNPDGDCVGSSLAVYHYILAKYPNKTVVVALDTKPDRFSYLPAFDCIVTSDFGQYHVDLCIMVDCSDTSRFKDRILIFDQSKEKLCIDHHRSNKADMKYTILNPDISSTCELLYEQMDKEYINFEVATCIYTGIVHDTGCFRYPTTTPKVLRIAADLLEQGVESAKMMEKSYFSKSYMQNQVLGRTLLESVLFADNRCIFSYITKPVMDFYGVTRMDLEGIIDNLRNTSGVEVAIFFYEIGSQTHKVSLRSKDLVDVGSIASFFGGGGHLRAAGCIMYGSPHDVVNNLSGRIMEQLCTME